MRVTYEIYAFIPGIVFLRGSIVIISQVSDPTRVLRSFPTFTHSVIFFRDPFTAFLSRVLRCYAADDIRSDDNVIDHPYIPWNPEFYTLFFLHP